MVKKLCVMFVISVLNPSGDADFTYGLSIKTKQVENDYTARY